MNKRTRINEQIRVPEIRVIAADGAQLGIMPTSRALELARQQELDLIEVSPAAVPPVAKILDWGKYRYEQEKQKPKQRSLDLKGIRLGVKISEHDLTTKLNLAEKFLTKKHKVKFQLRFKGREVVHKDLGLALLQSVIARLDEFGEVEQPPESIGRDMTLVLAPKTSKRKETEE